MQNRFHLLVGFFLSLVLITSGCNLSSTTPTPSPSQTPVLPSPTPVYHNYPPDPLTAVSTIKDETFPSNTGDNYQINLYERPFQLDNTYRPDADIASSSLSENGDWYYFSTKVAGVDPATKLMDSPIGFEIDYNQDGRGDFLLWGTLPFSIQWTNTNLQVYADTNHDVGNRTPLRSDAPISVKSDGYETALFSNGSGSDPEAAWVRQSPLDPNELQIAVKKTLINQTSFLWGAWTDFDLGKPVMFDYNDAFTAQEAGSPYASNPNYPLKALYGMDNTCRAAFGFTPTGDEPGLCGAHPISPTLVPVVQPTDTVPAPPQPGSINGVVTILDANGHGTGTNAYPLYLFANSCTGSSINSTTPDSSGNYSFPNLSAGTYCVDLFYSGSPVQPGNPQTVGVSSGNNTTVNFAIVPPG